MAIGFPWDSSGHLFAVEIGSLNQRTLSLTCGQRSHIFTKISFLAMNLDGGHWANASSICSHLVEGDPRSAQREQTQNRAKANAMARGSQG